MPKFWKKEQVVQFHFSINCNIKDRNYISDTGFVLPDIVLYNNILYYWARQHYLSDITGCLVMHTSYGPKQWRQISLLLKKNMKKTSGYVTVTFGFPILKAVTAKLMWQLLPHTYITYKKHTIHCTNDQLVAIILRLIYTSLLQLTPTKSDCFFNSVMSEWIKFLAHGNIRQSCLDLKAYMTRSLWFTSQTF